MDSFNRYGRTNMSQHAPSFYHERPDVDVRRTNKKKSLAVKIILWVLLGVIVLYSLYAFLVHPVDELNVRLALAQNCRIKITVSVSGYQYQRAEYVIEIDGNVMLITSGSEKRYYVTENDKTYEYREQPNGQWSKFEFHSNNATGSSINLEFLLDRSNYERAAWWKPFTWRVKNGTTEVTRVLTKIKFSRNGSGYKQTIVFDRIGTTKIDRPWEQQEE